MRGKLMTVFAAATVSAVAITISIVSAATAGPNVTRLEVVERATTDTVVDLTTNGDSTGDLLTFHNELYDDRNRTVVGSDQGECTRIEVGVSWECRWVNQFDEGSITVEGPFLDAGSSNLAITGGTGAYRDARGTMRLVARDDAGTEFDFVFRVVSS
jgi:allene oxide cyclase